MVKEENKTIPQGWYTSDQDMKEYLERKYPPYGTVDERRFDTGNFQNKEMIWNGLLQSYSFYGSNTKSTFSLINVDDLTLLVSQLNENNWQDIEFMKKFGIDEIAIRVLSNHLDFGRVYYILDNLANQLLVRCIIVTNRLTHGIDKESEENIMSLGFMYQSCASIPEPKVFTEKYGTEGEHEQLKDLVNKVKNGDVELLSKLQDLPYLKEEFLFPATKNLRQRITGLETELRIEREEVKKFQEKSEEWSKRQLKELQEEKDNEIKLLKAEIENLKKQLSQTENQYQSELKVKK